MGLICQAPSLSPDTYRVLAKRLFRIFAKKKLKLHQKIDFLQLFLRFLVVFAKFQCIFGENWKRKSSRKLYSILYIEIRESAILFRAAPQEIHAVIMFLQKLYKKGGGVYSIFLKGTVA